MIIGIGGKMGSGKNLVCTIIQGLTAAKKHNIENPSFEWIKKYYINSIWEQKAFAGKLKQIASLLTGIPVEKFEDQDFKQSYMGEQWAKTPIAPLSEATLFDAVDLNNLMTYREFLQKLGTEAMRDGLHTNVWVNALFADYKPTQMVSSFPPPATEEEYIAQQGYPSWCITDMRFPNEMEAVVAKGGITIRVTRDVREFKEYFNGKEWVKKPMPNDIHPSETALDDAKFDYEIINDGSIEDLIEKVREILINEKLL